MAQEYGLISYLDESRREDLIDVVTTISPTDTPFTTGLPRKSATNTLHEWTQDVLADRAANAQIEGLGPTYQACTAPERYYNVTQIIRKDGEVSGTQRAISHAGFKDAFSYQVSKKTKEWKNDLEYNCITQTANTGASATARQMIGALSMITSVATALQSALLSETIYNDLLQISWGYGGRIDEVYVGGWLKRKISAFIGNSTDRTIASGDMRVNNSVKVYDGDFGTQKIFLSHDLNSTGASTTTMMMIDRQYWALAYLRNPILTTTPRKYTGGDKDAFNILGELTLECRAQDANAKVTGLSNQDVG